jgi:membrane protease YdiL (CAAX protease family)
MTLQESENNLSSKDQQQDVFKYSLLDILMLISIFVGLELVLYVLSPKGVPLLAGMIVTLCFLATILLWVTGYRKWTKVDLGLTNLLNARNNWTGIGLGFLMAFVFIGLDTNTVYLFFHQPNLTFINFFLLILLIPMVTLISPMEEIVYRGFLFTLLKKRAGLFLGIVLSSILFALAHKLGSEVESIYSIRMIGFLHKFVLGIIFAFFFNYTKSLSGPMLAHIVYNWCAITVYLIAHNTG